MTALGSRAYLERNGQRPLCASTCPRRDSAGWQVLAGQRPQALRPALSIRISDDPSRNLMAA